VSSTAIRFLALLIAAVVAHTDARADEPFYKGKRLTLLIGSAAGGPTDIEGRLFAKYLVRHIAGEPTVVAQNKYGAGGVVGPTYLGEVAPRDGSMLGYFSGAAWNFVNNPERWRVDLKSFAFICYQSGTTIHFVRTDVPPGLKVPADIVKAQGLVAGGLAVDNPKDIRLRLALDMLGVPYTYVTGFGSGSPARLALQRGEIHMFSESPPSYRAVIVPAMVATGEVIPVFYDSSDTGDLRRCCDRSPVSASRRLRNCIARSPAGRPPARAGRHSAPFTRSTRPYSVWLRCRPVRRRPPPPRCMRLSSG
jgi:tripartite-type tricarboxylate transporter receptor subunit TctC